MPVSDDASCLEMLRSIIRLNSDGPVNSKWVEVFVDFENAVPTEAERYVYELVENVLVTSNDLLVDVASYGDGGYKIRSQLKNDSDVEALKSVLHQLEPFVARTFGYYEHVQRIEAIVPEILWELTSGPIPLEEQLINRQAIAKQFARIIEFVLDFDAIKMSTAQITNDYSYYRRARHIVYQDMSMDDPVMSKGQLPQVQMFLCEKNPMLRALCNGVDAYVNKHAPLPLANTTDAFVTMINVCRFMLSHEECLERLSPESRIFCLRVMVGLVILYDHVDTYGAFTSNGPIDIRDVVRLVKLHSPDSNLANNFLAGLRFTTKHFMDSTTPKSIRQLIEA